MMWKGIAFFGALALTTCVYVEGNAMPMKTKRNAEECEITFKTYDNPPTPGFLKQPGVNTLQACIDACRASSACWSLDFDNNGVCWFGKENTPVTNPDPNIVHMDKVQICQDVDNCANANCANGGVCVNGVNSFRCQCADGYSGPNCETNIDECFNVKCGNGGSCVDGISSYSCKCLEGFSGTKCELGCPPKFTELQGGCYYFVNDRRDWAGAQKNCPTVYSGAHLAVVTSKEEDNALINKLKSFSGGSCTAKEYFLGGQLKNVKVCDKDFRWKPDSNTNTPFTYTSWAASEPSCGSGIEACVHYYFDDLKWNDIDCSSSFCSICEYDRY